MSLSKEQIRQLREINNDPVKWAQAFLKTYNPIVQKITPWTARWYQVEMLRDPAIKKVYRCGRRTGKTETMVVDSLYNVSTKRNYRVLIITPFEKQVDLIFMRLNELINESPLLKREVVSTTKSPYKIRFNNESMILGFTTGASSGSGAASVRGQRADMIIMDEVDYMNDADFDSILMIAGERPGIRVLMSSTPTGRRSRFYYACTDKAQGFKEHYHPSTHNPSWCDEMEAEFRAMLSEQGYVHEIEAEFGTEEAGVFSKERIDEAKKMLDYYYTPLDLLQQRMAQSQGREPIDMTNGLDKRPKRNIFRTIGVDWDKYGASSSILVLEYNTEYNKCMVIDRIEIPRSEYTYDNAVNKIVELNAIYNPSWIYCDRGSGEYQIERLHKIGEENPMTGLKNKVKGWSFSNKIDILDPVTKEKDSKPLKPFMVTQLQIAFERGKVILSPWDDLLEKQLIDYRVERISATGHPVFTSENEHFVDALGLAYLAMVLEFKNVMGVIEEMQFASKMIITGKQLQPKGADLASEARVTVDPRVRDFYNRTDFDEPDRPKQVKVDMSYRSAKAQMKAINSGFSSGKWGSRTPGGGFGR